MGYVMVPIPEEFVEDAMRLVLELSMGDRLIAWDQEHLAAVFHAVDEGERSVMSFVARASLSDEGFIRDEVLAQRMEFTRREVLDFAKGVNAACTDAGHAPLIAIHLKTEKLPNGRTREERHLTMPEEFAVWIRETEQTELKTPTGPLPGDLG